MVAAAKRKTSTSSKSSNPMDVNSLGSGIRILGKEDVKLTVTRAEKFLEELQEFQGERNLREHWADHLANEMKRNNFRFEQVLLATALLNDQEYRVNGQHCCWARLEFRDDRSYDQMVTLLRYKCETEEDLRNLYSVFDAHGRRTRQHVIMAQLVGFQGWADVSRQAISLVAKGFPLYRWEEPKQRKSFDVRDHAYLLKTEFIALGVMVGRFLTDVASGSSAAHLHRAPVVAAMLGSFAKNSEKAREFWTPVHDGAGFEKGGDPRNKLRSELLSASVNLQSRGKKSLSTEEMMRKCIIAWNAWRQGGDRVSLNVNMKAGRPKFR